MTKTIYLGVLSIYGAIPKLSIKDKNERKRDIHGKTVENSGGAQVGMICCHQFHAARIL